jgi:hypothetical protein
MALSSRTTESDILEPFTAGPHATGSAAVAGNTANTSTLKAVTGNPAMTE